jgi:polyphosphate glucokinase
LEVLGIDVGGTNIKGAIVDIERGVLLSERIKYPTPEEASAENFIPILKQIKEDLAYEGKVVGVGFPAVVKNNICKTATNIDKSWIGLNLKEYFSNVFDAEATVVNDADAAGLAELYFGKFKNNNGTSILLTVGTGIGSALFIDDKLVPNTEFGHLFYKGQKLEKYISNKVRKEQELSIKEFAEKLNEVILHIAFIFSPDKILLGGGISKSFKEFKSCFDSSLKIKSAKFYNESGIIGAALAVKAMMNSNRNNIA